MVGTDHARQDIRIGSGLGAGAAVITFLVALTGEHHGTLWLAVGLLNGAAVTIWRAFDQQAYAYWIVWAAGTVNVLLLSWAEPIGRPGGLLLAALLGFCACILCARWARHRELTRPRNTESPHGGP